MSDAGPGDAGRRARPSVRCRDGERLLRTERPGDPIPVEGEPQADPDRAPARTGVPQGEPPGRGGTAARFRREVARRGAGSGPQGRRRWRPASLPTALEKHHIPLTWACFSSLGAALLILARQMAGQASAAGPVGGRVIRNVATKRSLGCAGTVSV